MPSRFLNNININDEYSLPNADGSADQIITTDGAGQLSFVDQSTINAGNAEHVVIYAKNTSGASIAKGTPVYITGTVGATDTVEIAPADAGNAAKMPSVGLLDDTLINNAFGYVITGGFMDNIITDPIDGATPSSNDTVYVKVGGGLTLTKPTGPTGLIQNVAKVGKVSGGNSGSLIVSSILRSNDVPNLTTGKIWVGDGNTVESTVVHLDEVNERMGINTASPLQTLQVNGGVLSTLGLYSDFALASNRNWSIETNTFGAGNWGGIAIKTSTSNGGDPSTARFGIDSSGNVGIGTTSPAYPLEVNGIIKTSSSFLGTTAIIQKVTALNTNGIQFTNNGGSEKMRITDAGNVGIGTTNPATKLHVQGGASGYLFRVQGTSILNVYDPGAAAEIGIGSSSGDKLKLFSNDSLNSGITIDTTGNVGIGATSPARKLEVYDSSSSMISQFRSGSGTSSFICFANTGSTADQVRIGSISTNLVLSTNYTERMRIDSTGNVGIGTTGPSEKLDINQGKLRILNDQLDPQIILEGSDMGRRWVLSQDEQDNIGSTGFYIAEGTNVDANDALLYLTPGGNVGVGTTSPESLLHLYKNNTSASKSLMIDQDGTGDATMSFRLTGVQEYAFGIDNSDGNKLKIANNGTVGTNDLLVIQTNGNVGIGTTSPQAKLHVFGTTSSLPALGAPASAAQIGGSSYGTLFSTLTSGVGVIQQGRNDGTAASYSLSLQPSGGNVGIGTTSPNEKLVVRNGTSNTDVKILSYNNAVGTEATLKFATVASDLNYEKAAIITRNYASSFGRSDMHFALDSAADSGNVQFSDTKMTILNNGNVGIGTTTPRTKLHVSGLTGDDDPALGSSTAPLFVSNTSNSYGLNIGVNNVGASWLQSQSNTSATAYEMSLNPLGGNVGVGFINPSYKLDVNGTGRFTDTLYYSSLVQTSQRDQKKDIADIDKSKAKAIPFKEYKYKTGDTERVRYGVVVEDIEQYYPELVHIGEDGVKGVSYVDLLVKRVAELEKELEDISLTPGPQGPQGATGATGAKGSTGAAGNSHLSNVEAITIDEKTKQLVVTINKTEFRFNPAK